MAPPVVQTIKVADLIHNTWSIVEHDPKFAQVYLREKKVLLGALGLADPKLMRTAKEEVVLAEVALGLV